MENLTHAVNGLESLHSGFAGTAELAVNSCHLLEVNEIGGMGVAERRRRSERLGVSASPIQRSALFGERPQIGG